MSEEVERAILNNLNEKVYLKNINRVIFRDNADYKKINSSLNDKKKKLELYELTYRHHNLKIYFENMLRIRFKQFMLIGVPALLSLSTAISFIIPSTREFNKKKDAYQLEETIIDSKLGEIHDNTQVYVMEKFQAYDYLDENIHACLGSSLSDKLRLEISNGIKSLHAFYEIGSNGELSYSNCTLGNYVDVNNYDFSSASLIEDRYKDLFDDVITLLRNNEELSEEVINFLDNMEDSDKKQMMLNIYNYSSIGEISVSYVDSSYFLRIFFCVVDVIYVIGLLLWSDIGSFNKGISLSNSDGKLITNRNSEIGLLHVGLKYNEAFLAAERDRIREVINIVDDIVFADPDQLLTKYERKLRK